ncbi:MAG: HAMP domain-containing sensor histidine kinase [Candidatus Margulisbacteria bacterium]|nr:HAMP domain-containing sensor histidine kinase [Candidatus Margulisiibacteriota bacterium]
MKVRSTIPLTRTGQKFANWAIRRAGQRAKTEISILRHAVKISEKQALLGRLAAAILHRIKNRMQVVRGQAELLSDGLTALCDKAQEVSLDRVPTAEEWKIILKAIKQCKDTVAKLSMAVAKLEQATQASLGFARTKEDQRSFAEQEVRTIIELLQSLAIFYQVRLEVSIADETAQILVPLAPSEFKDILEIVVSNAIEAFPLDSGENKEVKVILLKRGNQITISIADNGVGIPGQVKERLFQEPVSTVKGQKGTGIGCFLAGQYIRKAGGEVQATSRAGGGTTVTITLPICSVVNAG